MSSTQLSCFLVGCYELQQVLRHWPITQIYISSGRGRQIVTGGMELHRPSVGGDLLKMMTGCV